MMHPDNISVRMVRRDVADIFNVEIGRTFFTYMEFKSIAELHDPGVRDLMYRTIRRDKSAGKFDDVCAMLHMDDPDRWCLKIGQLMRDVAQRLSDMKLLFPCGQDDHFTSF